MLPLIIGAGALIGLLVKAFSSDDKKEVPQKKKLFISFAIEDAKYRDYLVKQGKNPRSPFEFIDMSVKKPWKEDEWKKKCRTKIKRCDGMIVLLSKNTWHSGGARWEIKCGKEEGKSVIGMHVRKNDIGAIPPELKGKQVIIWDWNNLSNAIKKI